jgi:hypothetical protein
MSFNLIVLELQMRLYAMDVGTIRTSSLIEETGTGALSGRVMTNSLNAITPSQQIKL